MKRRAAKNQGDQKSEHKLTLHHQRLYQALNLGIKYRDNEGKKWQCTDIEIQRLTIRSISAFVGCVSPDMLHHPLVKDSAADMLVALIGITESKNESVLGVAAEVTVMFVKVLGNLISFAQLSKLISSFSCLLSFRQSSIAASCANALDHIFLKLAPSRLRSQNEVWKILKESKAVDCIICNLQDFITGCKPYEIFQVMASLLRTILRRWPPSRYTVWSNPTLMQGLKTILVKSDSSVKVLVLQLYSAIGSHFLVVISLPTFEISHFHVFCYCALTILLCISALCGSGANKLLQDGETYQFIILHCMGSSQPHYLRVEAFRLTQCLVRSKQGWLMIARTCCDSIVKAIIDVMVGWNLSSGKVPSEQVPLLTEACKLALITRWAGEHHTFFWKLGIDKVLLNLLIDDFYISKQAPISFSPKELVAAARKGLDANYLGVLRPYIWDTLGWLATHCPETFSPDVHGNNCLDVLITCGCVILMDAVHKGRQRFLYEFSASKLVHASRAVLLMIHSRCKYIASQARDIISELSTPNVEVYLIHALGTINSINTGENFMVVNKDQTIIDLIIMSCLSAMPEYHSFVIRRDGIKILSAFAKWCLSNNADIPPNLQLTSNCSTCCMLDMENWEGGDSLPFFSMWGLVELIQYSRNVKDHNELISQVVGGMKVGGSDVQTLIDQLQKISGSTYSSHGLRWCAAYILSLFGFYGFPSRFGKRIGKALSEKELTDMHLILSSGEYLRVHSVILMVRCPSMLPSGESPNKRMYDGLQEDIGLSCGNVRREVRLSARVDRKTLMKLLEFVYTGFAQVDNDLVKQLRLLARGCDFHSLSQMLARKCLKWGTTMLSCDLTSALGTSGLQFSDIILEAKADELVEWACTHCSFSSPHMHVHKIILWLSCDYLKALLQSGMQESHSQNIKVPVSWEALTKLVSWFYSDELLKPSSGCIWTNMDADHQLEEVHPYLELCWLAEFWLMEDFRIDALNVVLSCLRSSRNLPLKIIRVAFELSQWEVVEVATDCLAPLYPHLRDSGDFVFLNDELVDMVRVAYVQLTQAGDCDNSD